VSAVFAAWVVGARANQIVAGTAVTLACVVSPVAVYRQAFGAGGAGSLAPDAGPVRLPGLAAVPLVGPALFAQPILTYAAAALVPLVWWGLYRTRWGLALRATERQHPWPELPASGSH